MRPFFALVTLLLATPVGAAASQVHVTYTGTDYAVSYVDNATGALATLRIPLTAGSYELDGRTYPLAPPPTATTSTRIVFVADIGTDANATAVLEAIQAQRPSLVILGGDLAYAHGDPDVWEKFFAKLEPLAASVPVMPAFGNHEGYCDRPDGGYETCAEEREFYDARFVLPNDDELYYAFDWGPMRVTVLDTEAYVGDDDHPTTPEEQGAFLNASLRNDSSRWDIVAYHRPLRTTNLHEGAEVGDQREHLEPALDGGADLVLQAHVHAYERAKPTANGTLFVTSGGGGRPTYEEWDPEPAWLAKRSADHHFVVLDVSPTRIDGRALRPDGSVLDTFSLDKPAPPAPTPTPITTTRGAPTEPPTASDWLNNTTPTEVAESDTPLGWIVALVAITLSARLSKRLFPR